MEGKCVFVLVQLEGREDAGTCENQGSAIEKWINNLRRPIPGVQNNVDTEVHSSINNSLRLDLAGHFVESSKI